MEKKYYLEGLDCANCANKIETRVKSISYINSVSLNFIQKTLSFNLLDDKNSSQVLDEIKAIVNNLEPDVKVLEDKALALEGFNKFKIIRVILGIAIFILAILFKPGPAVSLIMFLTSYFIIGYEVLWRAIKNIFSGQFMDENFLMCLATVGAFLIGEYSEGVAVMIFYQIGEAFQDMAVDRSRNSIKELMDIRPDYANIIISGSDESKKEKPENVKIGDLILIKPGEKIPLDSIIVKGSSSIDTKALTGESIPLNVGIGDSILSGGININGVLVAEVAKGFGESTVSKILGLVENASSKKSATENFITGFAKIYTPVVVSLAAIIAFIVPFILSEPFSLWVSRALVFLVISCPCALVLSVPLSYFAGIGAMSKKGILVKGSNYLEALNNSEIFVFDKTGTLTEGVFGVTEVKSFANISEGGILKYAAYAEYFSSHPMAVSIKNYYSGEIDPSKIENYQDIAGKGISANVFGEHVLAGNSKLLKDYGIGTVPDMGLYHDGSIMHIAVSGLYAGYIVVSDKVKATSKDAIERLHKAGAKEIIMLTGDNKINAEKVGQSLGVDRIYSELLPQGKVEALEAIMDGHAGKVAFIGDGINDAPVLRRADVGIAMGGLGSDAAIEASDVVIMNDDVLKIVTAKEITKYTHKIVYQNIIFSLGVKVLFLILGVFSIIGMEGAIFADVGVSLIAILNSLRILNRR